MTAPPPPSSCGVVDQRPVTTALLRVIDALACPVCGADLVVGDRSLTCPSGHSFDIARQGTVTLADHRANLTTADTAAMVEDRATFYDGGAYDAVIASICSMIAGLGLADDARIMDAGAGTGHLLTAVLDANPTWIGIAVDSSKPAVRMAARRCPRTAGVVADLWRSWPLRTGSLDLVLTMFAPRNANEVQRVLRSGGAWVMAVPLADHLVEVREQVGLLGIPADKVSEVVASLPKGLTAASREQIRHQVRLTRDDVATMVRMGPNRHHISDALLAQQVAGLHDVQRVTQAVEIVVMRRV